MFHRIDDWESMPADRYCRLAPLLPAYGGAVHWVLLRAAGTPQDPNLIAVPNAAAPPRAAPTPISPAVAAMDMHNADLFSFATSGGGDV